MCLLKKKTIKAVDPHHLKRKVIMKSTWDFFLTGWTYNNDCMNDKWKLSWSNTQAPVKDTVQGNNSYHSNTPEGKAEW